jgi:hypothetical protein
VARSRRTGSINCVVGQQICFVSTQKALFLFAYSESPGADTLTNLAAVKRNGEVFHPITFGRANFWRQI